MLDTHVDHVRGRHKVVAVVETTNKRGETFCSVRREMIHDVRGMRREDCFEVFSEVRRIEEDVWGDILDEAPTHVVNPDHGILGLVSNNPIREI